MKKFVILTIAFLASVLTFSQKWVHTIGQPNHYESTRRVIEHYDKGYLISAQYDDIGFLIKTDINGNVLWNKIFGNAPEQVITEKTLYDDQGNFYLIGAIYQNIEPFWPLVIKLNSCGEILWSRQLYFNEFEFGSFYDAILLENGNILALADMPDEDKYDEIFLCCISPDGEYLWKKSYASKSNHPNFGPRIGTKLNKFNDFFVISGLLYSPYPGNPTVKYLRPMFIGIDSMFNENWVLEYGINDSLKGLAYQSIAVNDSIYMGVGAHIYNSNGESLFSSWIMLFDKNGTQLNYKIFPNESFNQNLNSTVMYDVQNVSGNTYLTASGFSFNGGESIFIGEIVFDTSGNILNFKINEGIDNGTVQLAKTFDNKYVITTCIIGNNSNYDIYYYKIDEGLEQDTIYPGNYTYDSLCPYQIQSGTIDLTGCSVITNINDIPWLEDYNKRKDKLEILAYPNPANEGQITIEFKNIERYQNIEMKCFNVYGKLMFTQEVKPSQKEAKVNIESWPSGVYLINLFENQKLMASGKFVRK